MDLKRNAGKVMEQIHDLPSKPTIAKGKLVVQFPVRFRDIKLAVVGEQSYVFGLFAIIYDDSYALMNINGYVELGSASSISIEEIEGIEYYSFTYEPGDVLFRTKEIVARSNLIFLAIDEFVFKGKVPWYIEYNDMCQLFKTAAEYSGTKAKISPAVMEFLAAYIARSKTDRTKFIREVAEKPQDFSRKNISWVPLRSVFWSAPGTVNKISGAYFADGVVSALVNPSKRVEKVESILRA